MNIVKPGSSRFFIHVAMTQLIGNFDRPILGDIATAIYQAIED